MTVANAGELLEAVRTRAGLARALSRHAYGMRRWIDVIGGKLQLFDAPADKALAARLVGDNGRHMLLFRERAQALGDDPDAYTAPPSGEAIYDRLEALDDPAAVAAFALGSLDHFAALISLYRDAADPLTDGVLAEVEADVAEQRRLLGRLADGGAGEARQEAESMYETRELTEVDGYRGA
jgi:hypothetical protein